MKLFIEHAGELHEVLDDLEGYDLDKMFARVIIMDEIQSEVKRLKDTT